ncbi:EcoAI/FtnUII family type I restriction enzme subunit R [Promineifilum sp.]|uniref:EcoAI/FtnUII family type I restriction enzme subunit R n=1 Tax=Promineifilum sp. TaxID=2664178 RepID=UPI0035B34711
MSKKGLTEQEIRSRYIRPALVGAGWGAADIREEYYLTDGRMHVAGETATRGERSFVDYLLLHRHVPLAVVEAKDNRHAVGGGLQQALRYAELLDAPFAYSSNGDGFIEHCRLPAAGPIERELPLAAFPAPDDLWARYTAAHALTPETAALITQPYYRERGGKTPRYYQEVAIQRALNAVAGGQRRLLLVMATGTGKTFTVAQIMWRLWKAGRVGRMLFLADRNFLIDQAKTNDFKQFADVMTKITGRVIDKSYQLYLALYQGVSGSEEWHNVYRQFSPDFFDLVVIDECHRGSAADDSAWREVLTYFDSAIQIGLTATPKETAYVSNIDYFGAPLYTYSLRQGIDDGFLAPYKVLRVNVDKDAPGWLPAPGQTDKYGHVIEPRQYNVLDWDRAVVLEQRNELVAERVADYLRATDPYAKTIVFCVDIAHAERLRRCLVNAIGGEAAANRRYVMRITGDSPEGKNELDNFISPEERFPVIATTSKLLTTGLDVQTCKVIVLDTIINSMTEFKQIIGRGTRLRPDLGKTHFTIIDFRDVTRLFYDPAFDGDPVQSDEWPGEPPDLPPAPGDDPPEPAEKSPQYVVDDVPVWIVRERVQYYDPTGALITQSFADYSRDRTLAHYRTLDDFLQSWDAAGRKKELIVELIRRGVLLEELAQQAGGDYDPFDLVCHVAYGQPPLTRRQRASAVQRDDVFTRHGETARAVLAALLDRYADSGIEAIETAADPRLGRELLQLPPFNRFGTPMEIVRAFGGRDAYAAAVSRLRRQLYHVH